jgi:F-type H+-transporting ATPase subunit epsilon
MATTFRCTLVTPEQEMLDQQVVYASIPAWDGKLGVQHLRAPLMAKLGFGQLRLDMEDGSSQSYFVGGGFAQVKDDVLTLLTEEAMPLADIDRQEAAAALSDAHGFQAGTAAELERRERDLNRARALVALAPSS